MSKTAKKKKPTADEIAEMAISGEDASRFFTKNGEMRPSVQRVILPPIKDDNYEYLLQYLQVVIFSVYFRTNLVDTLGIKNSLAIAHMQHMCYFICEGYIST